MALRLTKTLTVETYSYILRCHYIDLSNYYNVFIAILANSCGELASMAMYYDQSKSLLHKKRVRKKKSKEPVLMFIVRKKNYIL